MASALVQNDSVAAGGGSSGLQLQPAGTRKKPIDPSLHALHTVVACENLVVACENLSSLSNRIAV